MDRLGAPLQSVEVSRSQCERLAALVRTTSVPLDREDSNLTEMAKGEAGNFYLALVAICHQTSPQGRPPLEGRIDGRHLRGWDYLSARLEVAVREDRELLTPLGWSRIGAARIREMFRDRDLGDRITDPEGRAAILRDLGSTMLERGWRNVDDLYWAAQRRIGDDTSGLVALLSETRAYRDPVRKKTYFFLALMQNTGIWEYADPESLGAPVDYHEVRGHLRLGTVIVRDSHLERKLRIGTPVTPDEDIAIRAAVAEAIRTLSKLTGLNDPSRLHYLFWNVFRSCCSREAPHCGGCPAGCSLPDRYVLALHGSTAIPRACPYASICTSAGKPAKLNEHYIETEYY